MPERLHPLLSDFPRGAPGKEPQHYHSPSAGFANPYAVLEESRARWKPGFKGMFLGLIGGKPELIPDKQGNRQWHILGGTAIGAADDRHICTFAGSRAGKGRSVIVPNMLHYPGSVLATDPKGELAVMTARRRKDGLKQKVYVLDPFPSDERATASYAHQTGLVTGFNPIKAMREGREIEDAALIGDALVVVSEESDPHWDESARALIEAVVLHVRTSPEFDERQRNLLTVQDLIARGLPDGSSATGFSVAPALCRKMINNGAAAGVIRHAGDGLLSMQSKERESVLSSARRHLKFLNLFRQTAAGRRTLEEDGFRLESLKLEPTTVYLCLPARFIGPCSRWLRLFVNLTMQAMEQTTAPVKPGPGGVPVLFCLDEFASLGYMKQLEDAAGQIAGFGVKLWPVLQDLGQLRALYKDRWETFLGNAGVLQFFGNTDLGTLKWISERCGRTSIRERTDTARTESQAGQGLKGESWSTQVYDLLGVDEAAALFGRDDPQLRQLILWGGLSPIVLQRAHYDTHALFQDLWDDPP